MHFNDYCDCDSHCFTKVSIGRNAVKHYTHWISFYCMIHMQCTNIVQYMCLSVCLSIAAH